MAALWEQLGREKQLHEPAAAHSAEVQEADQSTKAADEPGAGGKLASGNLKGAAVSGDISGGVFSRVAAGE